MKKILLSIILITYTNHLISQQRLGHFTQEESEILDSLYESYMEDKLFYKKLSNFDLSIRLAVLSKNIQLLSQDICLNKSIPILSGLTSLAIMTCFALEPIRSLYKLYAQFISRKFKDIHIPFHWIEKLSSTIINPKEKEYLKRFSFEKLYVDYKEDPFFQHWSTDPQTGKIKIIAQDDIVKDRIACLSFIENEKIIYLALQSAIRDLKWQAKTSVFCILMYLGIGICLSIPFFEKAISYEAKTQEKLLKTSKALYNLLEKEQEDRFY